MTGTAAVGAALPNADVSVTDSASSSICAETTIVTTGIGTFTCTVLAGKSAPFLIVVTDPLGRYPAMVSIVGTTPAAGSTLVANATPLTTAIASRLAPDGDPLSLAANRSLIDPAALSAVRTNVLAQLAPVLSALGAPADYDPFTTQIVATTSSQSGNTADRVIETLRFTEVNGVLTVTTIDNPGGGVPVAGASTANPPTVPAPSTAVASLSQALQLLSSALNRCFALPVASRVLAVDDKIPAAQGGPEVTTVAPACEDIVHPDYLHRGYSAGQRFNGLLRDPAMVGATFMPPEILLFIDDTSAADQDQVSINLRFVDANGVAGNVIELARKFPGSATAQHATDWWLHGNQQAVEAFLRAFVRRREQFAPNAGSAGPFVNAARSRFETGIEIFVNMSGPGSTGLRAARVKGPGLPPAGLVLTRPDPAIADGTNWMSIRRKDGLTDPATATLAASIANIFRLQRTMGLTGTEATTVRPNPNAGTASNELEPSWAHPVDYGFAAGTANYIDFAQLKAMDQYQFELYYDGETAPRYTYPARRATAVVPSTRGVNLQWVGLTPATLAFLDPAGALAAEQPSLAMSWTANPFAETIASVGVYSFGGGTSVNVPSVSVARGATSRTVMAPGPNFRALTGDGMSGRSLQWRYRMLDGSYKDSFAQFN